MHSSLWAPGQMVGKYAVGGKWAKSQRWGRRGCCWQRCADERRNADHRWVNWSRNQTQVAADAMRKHTNIKETFHTWSPTRSPHTLSVYQSTRWGGCLDRPAFPHFRFLRTSTKPQSNEEVLPQGTYLNQTIRSIRLSVGRSYKKEKKQMFKKETALIGHCD